MDYYCIVVLLFNSGDVFHIVPNSVNMVHTIFVVCVNEIAFLVDGSYKTF